MIFKNAIVINPKENTQKPCDIKVENGIIVQVEESIIPTSTDEVIDLTGKYISPGLVEIHCHLREPGFEDKETIETGINSAINGGYTAICPMANTNPIVDDVETLSFVINKAKQAKNIGFYPICAVSEDFKEEKIVDVKELIKNGAIAFSNDGKPIENMNFLREALKEVNANNSIIISHSEDSSLAKGGSINEGNTSKNFGIKGIPDIAESVAIARELEVVRNLNVKYHFAHVSTKRSVELIRQAKKEGLNVTCETAPHYFSLSEEDIVELNAKYKMNPPLRTIEDKEAIIQGLIDGTIDVIATDHAPHTKEEKAMPIQNAPMGIVGFETALGVTLNYLVHTGKLSLIEAIKKLTYNPAKILNIENQGIIEVNKPANLLVFDLNQEWVVDVEKFKSKGRITPFDKYKLKGKPLMTVINGKINYIE